MKIPPRDMFHAQVISTFWACFVQVGVTAFLFAETTNLCGVNKHEPMRPSHFKCNSQKTFYAASIIWGLIGPARSFAVGQEYAILNIAFIIGAVLPIPTWYLAKRYPKSWIRLINWPVFFSSTGMMVRISLSLPLYLLFFCIHVLTVSFLLPVHSPLLQGLTSRRGSSLGGSSSTTSVTTTLDSGAIITTFCHPAWTLVLR